MSNDNSAGYPLVLHAEADPSRLGGTAICGFSTVGSVGVITTSHLISALGLDAMGTVLHPQFPAIALIHDSVPKHPVRVYQGEGLGVFTSEIQFPNEKDIYFGETVLEWFTKGGFDRLIVVDGVISNELGIKEEGELWGVSSTQKGRDQLDKAGIRRIQQGIVSGIAGYLIAEGERRGLEVSALLAECNPMYPDARAALIAVEGVSELIDREIPIQDLLNDARNIEERVREAFNRAQKTALPAPIDDDDDDEVQMVF
ncbi:PAC2 family protein [Euryarchaeota archaeon]|nr:proteasome assembly chaperone family protein [Candidatus Thalassarchaeum sp.]MDB3854958.1 PAC2 family protein [Euryarchaeota archaeon]MDB4865318.1 PAC2 family protein [Euryarchaeota archaeon]MDC3246927.1 PAC2 family protein [Euryarchaeota archaeon]MDC3281898.1 PAC2 family protein [Euryarchaeota archaeon]